MAKTKEELNALAEEVKTLQSKLSELSEEELNEISGGFDALILRQVAPMGMGKIMGDTLKQGLMGQSQPGKEEIRILGGQSNDPLFIVDGLPEREE